MKEIRIPLEYFRLENLLNKIINYFKTHVSPEVDPTYAIVWVESPGDVPVFGPESGWDVLAALKEEDKIVFFPFAHADEHGVFTWADGNEYGPMVEDEESDAGLLIGMEDCIGFLVQFKNGKLITGSAVHAGGGCTGPIPQVDLYPDCGVLERPWKGLFEALFRTESSQVVGCIVLSGSVDRHLPAVVFQSQRPKCENFWESGETVLAGEIVPRNR